MNPRRMVSEKTAEAIDKEVKAIVETAHKQALSILEQNRELLEQISRRLLDAEVIEGDNLKNLLVQAQPPNSGADNEPSEDHMQRVMA